MWLICAILTSLLYASPPEIAHPEYRNLEEVIDRNVRRINRRRLMGSVVLVSYKGEVVYLKAHGWQDRKQHRKMQTDTLFRMYSLSKPITSTAVLQLVEQGKVDLNAPIGRYIPELNDLRVLTGTGIPTPKTQPTVADLLRHSSGMTYGLFGVGPVDAMYNLDHPLLAKDSAEFIQRMAELPLTYEPGLEWRYSVSIDVLGVLVERVSGLSFGEYLEENLFNPLGMEDTGFVVEESQVQRFGPMYTRFGVELEPVEGSPFRNQRFESGGGGMVSTISDYNRFAKMIVENGTVDGITVLSPESVRLMRENQLPEGVRAINGDGFGYGFQVQLEANSQSPAGEYTWDGIGSTHFWADPVNELYVIALAQYMPFVPVLKYALRPKIYKTLDIEY